MPHILYLNPLGHIHLTHRHKASKLIQKFLSTLHLEQRAVCLLTPSIALPSLSTALYLYYIKKKMGEGKIPKYIYEIKKPI